MTETHWMSDDSTRRKFWAYAKGDLGLTEDEVHEALRAASTKDFDGDKDEAIRLLKAYTEDIDIRRLIKRLVPEYVGHTQARAIAWGDVYAPDGTRVNVTAREGTNAEAVAATALAWWQGTGILARLGWTLAAENGEQAAKRLAQDSAVLTPTAIASSSVSPAPPPPTSPAPPAPTAQAPSGNGGGELLTEFVKITMPKDKPVIEFWQPNRKWAEIKWYLGGEAFIAQVATSLGAAGWTAEHFDAVGKEYTVALKIVWAVSPKDAKYKDITAVTLR